MKLFLFFLLPLIGGLSANGQVKDTLTMKKIITTLYPDIDFAADTVGEKVSDIKYRLVEVRDSGNYWYKFYFMIPEYPPTFFGWGRNKGAALPNMFIPKDICDKCTPLDPECWGCY